MAQKSSVYVCVYDISKKQLQHQWNCEPAQGSAHTQCVCVLPSKICYGLKC